MGSSPVHRRTVRVVPRGRGDHNALVDPGDVAAVGTNVAEELLESKGPLSLGVVIDGRRAGGARGASQSPEKECGESGDAHGCGLHGKSREMDAGVGLGCDKEDGGTGVPRLLSAMGGWVVKT